MLDTKKKLTKHKKNMINGFMNCTKKIIREQGIDAVTIRKVAECSMMNSATIYNYFENLDHLIIFSIMDQLEDYIKALPDAIKDCDNSLDKFYAIWDCFVKYSFNSSDAYMRLFFSNLENQIEYYIEQYYKIFPMELNTEDYPDDVVDMLNSSAIFTRNIYIMKDFVAEGIIDEKDLYDINNIIIFTYEGLLRRVNSGVLDINKGISMFNNYIRKIINLFKK